MDLLGKKRKEERNEFLDRLSKWKSKGYNTSRLDIAMEKELEDIKDEFDSFERDVEKLKDLEERLQMLNVNGFETQIKAIKSKLKDVGKIPEIKKEILKLRKDIFSDLFLQLRKEIKQMYGEKKRAKDEDEKAWKEFRGICETLSNIMSEDRKKRVEKHRNKELEKLEEKEKKKKTKDQLLVVVVNAGKISMSDASKELEIDKKSVSKLAGELEKEKMIQVYRNFLAEPDLGTTKHSMDKMEEIMKKEKEEQIKEKEDRLRKKEELSELDRQMDELKTLSNLFEELNELSKK